MPGLLYHGGLEAAISKCRSDVDSIVKECRLKNRRFRDDEFDIEEDQQLCLKGNGELKEPKGFQRVTELFDDPHFFSADGTASSSDILQGSVGDCWFLAALSAVSSIPGCCIVYTWTD